MLRKLRPRSAYDVVALLALFVALGGTAYAVNTIGSDDVIDDSLTSADIKNLTVGTNDLAIDSVWGSRIRDNAILSAHVVDNVLNGNDIDEATLRAARTVARARQTAGSVSSAAIATEVTVPLTGNTWTQLNDETDQFFGEATVTPPTTCGGSGYGSLLVFLDGIVISNTTLVSVQPGTLTLPLHFSLGKVSPGTNMSRELTAKIRDNCSGGENFSVSNLKVDVLGTR